MMQAKPNPVSIRYYVCQDGHLKWTLPKSVFGHLLTGDLRLPNFAGQSIDILEVFSAKNNEIPVLLEARGTRGHFDRGGRLDTLHRSVGAVGDRILTTLTLTKRVVDLEPIIRQRRRQIDDQWQPAEVLKREVKAQLAVGRRKLPAFPGSK